MTCARLRATAAAAILTLAALYVAFMAANAAGFDFRAFYCAGLIAGAGGNPYHTQPLHACELYVTDTQLAQFARDTVLPAPLPGYAVAFFEALALLPFKTALGVWVALLVGSVALTAFTLHRLTGHSFAVIVAALTLCDALASVSLGEVMPLVICALALCALFVRRGRWVLAGLAAAATLLEPHVGVPACISLALWAPRTRGILAGAAVVLGTVSLTALGAAANVEYFTRVLPYHALAEIGSDAQLGSTAVLHALGASDGFALAAGTGWYLAMLCAGVFIARRMADAYNNDAFWVLTPPAFAVFGGAFVHVTQVAAALPFALLFLRCAPEFSRALAAVVVLLAVPWVWSGQAAFSAAVFVLAGYVAWEVFGADLRPGVVAAMCALALVAFFSAPAMRAPAVSNGYLARIPAVYAEAGWARENALYLSGGGFASWARRAPTWAGLGLLLGAAAYAGLCRTAMSYA